MKRRGSVRARADAGMGSGPGVEQVITLSQDAAHVFAGLDWVKHFTTSGWRYDRTLNTWKQASEHILRMIATRPEYSRLLGFNAVRSCPAGLCYHTIQ